MGGGSQGLGNFSSRCISVAHIHIHTNKRVWDHIRLRVFTNMLAVVSFLTREQWDLDLIWSLLGLDDRGWAAANCREHGVSRVGGWVWMDGRRLGRVSRGGWERQSVAPYPGKNWGNYFLLLSSVSARCFLSVPRNSPDSQRPLTFLDSRADTNTAFSTVHHRSRLSVSPASF